MADIKFSEFQKATISKDTDEIAILQDGVNKMIASPVLESKIINKTVSRVIDQGGASLNVINLKGVVPTYADLPTTEVNINDAYQVEADGLVYVYTENGFQEDGEGIKVQPNVDGVVEEGNTQAVSGGEVYENLLPILGLDSEVQDLKERTPTIDSGDDLFRFQDEEGAVVMTINKNGEAGFIPSEQTKERINYIQLLDFPGYLYAILDGENKVIFGVKSNGDIIPKITDNGGGKAIFNQLPYHKEKGSLVLAKTETIKEFINLPAIAVGRESAEGANDAPTIPLTTTGYTHPSVMYLPSGWNGFEYWMAITPTFGIIAEQPNPAAYENPHIFCSNDGINWQEPDGIVNPIDTPPHSPSKGYWSDTHLMLLPDGYLYCIYRGNYIPNKKLGISENEPSITIAHVFKRSKDGVNWEDFTFIQGTNNAGLNNQGGLMSPAFVYDNGFINCFDVAIKSTEYPYTGEGQYDRIVMRRLAKDFNEFKDTPYSQNNVVNFKNRPWQENHDVWHLDACKWGNTWFLLLNTSRTDLHTGSDLYLAYSGDGWNFDVIEQPISLGTSYRSCIVPILSSSDEIQFLVFNNFKTDGSTFLKKITLNYNLLNS